MKPLYDLYDVGYQVARFPGQDNPSPLHIHVVAKSPWHAERKSKRWIKKNIAGKSELELIEVRHLNVVDAA